MKTIHNYFLLLIVLAKHLLCTLPLIQSNRFIFLILHFTSSWAECLWGEDGWSLQTPGLPQGRSTFIAYSSLKKSCLLSLRDQNALLKNPWNRTFCITCALLISLGEKKKHQTECFFFFFFLFFFQIKQSVQNYFLKKEKKWLTAAFQPECEDSLTTLFYPHELL